MNLRNEEQILIKDIFAVTVDPTEATLPHLPGFARDVACFGRNFLLNKRMHLLLSIRLT